MIALVNILSTPFFDNIETLDKLVDKARSDMQNYMLTKDGLMRSVDSATRAILDSTGEGSLRELRYDLDLIKRGADLLIQEIDSNE